MNQKPGTPYNVDRSCLCVPSVDECETCYRIKQDVTEVAERMREWCDKFDNPHAPAAGLALVLAASIGPMSEDYATLLPLLQRFYARHLRLTALPHHGPLFSGDGKAG